MAKTFVHTSWNDYTVRVDWDLGNACNLNCSYCPTNTKSGEFANPGWNTVEAFALRMIEHYAGLGRIPDISFGASGEPTTVEWFPNLLRLLHNRVAHLAVSTNLTAPVEWWQANASLIHHVIGTVHYEYTSLRELYTTIEQTAQLARSISLQVPMLPEHFEQQMADIEWFEARTNIRPMPIPLLLNLYSGGRWIDYTAEQKQQLDSWHRIPSYNIEDDSSYQDQHSDSPVQSLTFIDVALSEQDSDRVFTGWQCYAGIDTLIIDSRGWIRNGWCPQHTMSQQHMSDWTGISQPNTCNMAWCRHHHDLLARKISG
jgi:hypothetical protein